MNQITAQVREIQSVQNLNILTLTCKDTPLKMTTLDLNETITKKYQSCYSRKLKRYDKRFVVHESTFAMDKSVDFINAITSSSTWSCILF